MGGVSSAYIRADTPPIPPSQARLVEAAPARQARQAHEIDRRPRPSTCPVNMRAGQKLQKCNTLCTNLPRHLVDICWL